MLTWKRASTFCIVPMTLVAVRTTDISEMGTVLDHLPVAYGCIDMSGAVVVTIAKPCNMWVSLHTNRSSAAVARRCPFPPGTLH